MKIIKKMKQVIMKIRMKKKKILMKIIKKLIVKKN